MKTIRNFSLLTALFSLMICGCASQQINYIPSDRKIESCTNSLGIACKAVPDAVFAEMLVRLQRLKDLQKKAEVDARLSVPKN